MTVEQWGKIIRAKAGRKRRTRPLTGINGVRELARLVGFRLRKERPGVYRVERVA